MEEGRKERTERGVRKGQKEEVWRDREGGKKGKREGERTCVE